MQPSEPTREYKIHRWANAIDRLAEENDDAITAELVVNAAKPARSDLHDAFEWDDRVAGHQFRLVQARELIRACYTVVTDSVEPERSLKLRAWAHVGGAYRPIDKVLANDGWKHEMMDKLAVELSETRRRYDAIGALQPLYKPVDRKIAEAEEAAKRAGRRKRGDRGRGRTGQRR